ncbi:MAG: hypothetical protein JXK92_10065 [Erysipelotrichaceae bacterium]|nr:hypothetical protein [Erysipelotrichaceae bacterium]
MEYLGMDLHGISELVEVRGRKILSRYPHAVNQAIKHTTAYQLNGTEIRLVPLEDCYVTLESMGRRHMTKVMVYYGDMAYPEEIHFEKETTIPVLIAKLNDVELTDRFPHPFGFSFDVVRICIFSDNVLIKRVSGKHRLPFEDEVPSLKMMTYGTSITQGFFPTAVDLTYPNIVARTLNADLVNYGLAGNCLCEKEVADFLMKSGTYDIVVLELCVNMLVAGISGAEFEKRVRYLVDGLMMHQPQAKIVCLGTLPFYADYGMSSPRDVIVSSPAEYRAILKRIVEEKNTGKIVYVDPMTALSMHNLSTDFIHPSNFGMIEIANTLIQTLK